MKETLDAKIVAHFGDLPQVFTTQDVMNLLERRGIHRGSVPYSRVGIGFAMGRMTKHGLVERVQGTPVRYKKKPLHVFMSFASLHTGKNLGAAVLQVDTVEDANEKAKELGIMPNECNQGRGYVVPDNQGLELNRLYTPQELDQLGFQKAQ